MIKLKSLLKEVRPDVHIINLPHPKPKMYVIKYQSLEDEDDYGFVADQLLPNGNMMSAGLIEKMYHLLI